MCTTTCTRATWKSLTMTLIIYFMLHLYCAPLPLDFLYSSGSPPNALPYKRSSSWSGCAYTDIPWCHSCQLSFSALSPLVLFLGFSCPWQPWYLAPWSFAMWQFPCCLRTLDKPRHHLFSWPLWGHISSFFYFSSSRSTITQQARNEYHYDTIAGVRFS